VFYFSKYYSRLSGFISVPEVIVRDLVTLNSRRGGGGGGGVGGGGGSNSSSSMIKSYRATSHVKSAQSISFYRNREASLQEQ
jgi:hypothetical protein